VTIDLSYTWSALPRLAAGAVVTLEVALAGMAMSLVLALMLTILRASGNRLALAALRVYLSYIRGTPLLVQILLVYYVLPRLGLSFPPLGAGIFALGFSSAAYVMEIMRGGIAAIPKGQVEAALALGLGRVVVWSKVILPQLYLLILPPLVNEFTQLIKATPLISVITVVELMRVAQELYNENFHPLEVIIGVAIIFFAMNFTLLRVMAGLERRNAVKLSSR
jgi:polar amino acid transport system permease protein